ncbi:hypothetical protein G4L39_02930 [Limisphaera ngatamarikiensis]|uniref:Uncharacterized protein n=1 Tax=Limisphaera ngatamarikiensis TaxID=1324935 RepID=A0A6M1RSN9_9BACT|nr:hypothetical protein [Limisphaera ngatamarikiensis]NGO38351.1 hypothetical protein [Limisphaera ngatamarikiensis]
MNMHSEGVQVDGEPGTRRRRSWLWYLGVGLVVVALLGLAGVAGLGWYWWSLVRNYTGTAPVELPAASDSELDRTALWIRWQTFYESVRQGRPVPPFELTADELNLLITGNPDLRDHLRVEITNGALYGRFSFPLGREGQRGLTGRFLNGRARIQIQFSDGWLSLNVEEMEANGRPIPRWILRRLSRENLARDLDRNSEAVEFLHQLEAVEIVGDRLVLRPLPPSP